MISSSYNIPGVVPTSATTSSHANSPQDTEHFLSVTRPTINSIQFNATPVRPHMPIQFSIKLTGYNYSHLFGPHN